MTKTAYIGIGSNLGDRLGNCLKAVALAQKMAGCKLRARSGFFRTEPVGVEGQDWYVNGAMALETRLTAFQLMEGLLSIEASMGRRRRRKWEARPIDLDLLLFGEEVIGEKSLTVPHPMMHLRRFVLLPMAQIAPDVIHPVRKKSMRALLDMLPEEGQGAMQIKDM